MQIAVLSDVDLGRMPLVVLFAAYGLGIVAATFAFLPPYGWLGLVVLGLIVSPLLKHRVRNWGLLFTLWVLGGWRYVERIDYPENHLFNYQFCEKVDTVVALVTQSEINIRSEQKLQLDEVHIRRDGTWVPFRGKLLLTYRSQTPRFSYGDVILFRTELRRPMGRRNPGEFDYRRYLRNHHIYALAYLDSQDVPLIVGRGGWPLRRWAGHLRIQIERHLEKTTNPPTAAILKALLVGLKGEIEPEVIQEFVQTGVIHVLAVSGLHVGYVTLVIMVILGFLRLPPHWRTVFTISGLIFYALLVDLRPSVVRAVIMASLMLISRSWEYRLSIYNSIAAAAFLQTLIDPMQLFDMGFQLSFLAVLSIVVLYRRIDGGIPERIKSWIRERRLIWSGYQLFLVSLAALIGTLPITVYYFQRIPLVALVANLLVVPLVGLICALGFAQVLLGAVWPFCGMAYGAVEEYLIKGLLLIVEWSSKVPFGSFSVRAIDLWLVVLLYLILIVVLISNMRRLGLGLVVLVLVGLNIWVWSPVIKPPALQAVFLDVGQGDAIFLRLPDNRSILIDTGDRVFRRDYGALVVVPYLKRQGIQRLSYLILTHPHSDHIGGAPYLLRHIYVDTICFSPQKGKSNLCEEIQQIVDSLAIPQRILKAGDYLCFNAGIIFVLHPSERFLQAGHVSYNDGSLVLKVSFRGQKLLLCGDIETEAENHLLGYGEFLASQIIKVPHHGSATSSTPSFLDLVQPEMAVISVGAKNKFNHPDSTTVARYRQRGVYLHRTDQAGALQLQIKGSGWQVKNWH